MNVADLQQFLRQVSALARSAGASDKVMAELARLVACFEPFHSKTLAEFNDFLRLADEYVRTGVVPSAAPAKRAARPRTPKEPKITPAEGLAKFRQLYERATDPTLDYATIDAEIEPLDALTLSQLKEIAAQIPMTLPKSRAKKDVLDEFRRKVKERKGTHERTQFRPDEPHTQ
ncbi:MAG: hypothetical protein FJ303_14475 [Planctomycetes bacterium]|nr:hypothetical protein [Planctomycetota bacterium]